MSKDLSPYAKRLHQALINLTGYPLADPWGYKAAERGMVDDIRLPARALLDEIARLPDTPERSRKSGLEDGGLDFLIETLRDPENKETYTVEKVVEGWWPVKLTNVSASQLATIIESCGLRITKNADGLDVTVGAHVR